MKTKSNMKYVNLGLVVCIAATTLVGCKKKHKKGSSPDTPVVEEVEKITKPTKPMKKPKAVVPTEFSFVEKELELQGDFRVKTVKRDGNGNYYAAIVSDIVNEDKSVQPGYLVIKFDEVGEEVWRFPTRENVAVDADTIDRKGSYLLGSLTDIHVTEFGDIYLLGLRTTNHFIQPGEAWKNFKEANWPLAKATVGSLGARTANVVFVSKIEGSGMDANSPQFSSYTNLVSPVWWTPNAIKTDLEGDLIIESSSDGANGVVQQTQVIQKDFEYVKNSICYISQGRNSSSNSDQKLINVASGAPVGLVENMLKPLTMSLPVTTVEATTPEQFNADALKANAQNKGRCWDLIKSTVMVADDEGVNVVKPTVAAEGEEMTSQVESLEDLISESNDFEAYKVTNEYISGSNSWETNPFALQASTFQGGFSNWFGIDDEFIHVGLDRLNQVGSSQLVIGNGRTFKQKSWKINLRSSTQRQPGSIDVRKSESSIYVAWTDLHLTAETFANERSLRIANIPTASKVQKDVEFFEFNVPEETGHSSFSSVRLADGPNDFPAVFATVGTRQDGSNPKAASMASSTLLIGFKN
jgi:hypothetical protein